MDSNPSRPVTRAVSRRKLIRAGATAGAVAALPISASAQEDDDDAETSSSTTTASSSTESEPESNSTTTETETETESEPETMLAQITPGVALVDYEVVDESAGSVEWRIVVESKYPTQLVLSDVLGSLGGGGAVSQVEQDRRTITSGRTEATISTGTYDETGAVGVAVPGGAVTIGHGVESDEPRVTLPFGVTLGASIFGAGTIFAAKKKAEGFRDEPEDVDADDGGLL